MQLSFFNQLLCEMILSFKMGFLCRNPEEEQLYNLVCCEHDARFCNVHITWRNEGQWCWCSSHLPKVTGFVLHKYMTLLIIYTHVDIIWSFDNAFACSAGVKKRKSNKWHETLGSVLETTEHPSNSITTTSNTLVALQYFQPTLYDYDNTWQIVNKLF